MTTISMADMIRTGRTMDELTKDRMEKIEQEMLEEPCEICGKKTRDVGQLFANDVDDGMGHHIVQMVCAKCISKNNSKAKAKTAAKKKVKK